MTRRDVGGRHGEDQLRPARIDGGVTTNFWVQEPRLWVGSVRFAF